MSIVPAHDERTRYSSHRADPVDIQAWPEFDEQCRKLLESFGHVIRPEPSEVLWDSGDSYDLYLVLAGGVCLLANEQQQSQQTRPVAMGWTHGCNANDRF